MRLYKAQAAASGHAVGHGRVAGRARRWPGRRGARTALIPPGRLEGRRGRAHAPGAAVMGSNPGSDVRTARLGARLAGGSGGRGEAGTRGCQRLGTASDPSSDSPFPSDAETRSENGRTCSGTRGQERHLGRLCAEWQRAAPGHLREDALDSKGIPRLSQAHRPQHWSREARDARERPAWEAAPGPGRPRFFRSRGWLCTERPQRSRSPQLCGLPAHACRTAPRGLAVPHGRATAQGKV